MASHLNFSFFHKVTTKSCLYFSNAACKQDLLKAKEVPLKVEYIFKDLVAEIIQKDGWYYRLERIEGFEDLSDRVVIEWGKATLS